VIRDPTGAVPCDVTHHKGLTIVFSWLEDCLALGLQRYSINWSYARAWLVRGGQHLHDTGLNEVTTLRAGERLELRAGAVERRTVLWDLFEQAAAEPLEDFETAAASARRTVDACVGAWASCHSNFVHLLSGGIDSAIVLTSLLRAPSQPAVTCINYFDASLLGDERSFARLASQHAAARFGNRTKLIELERDPTVLDFDSLQTPLGVTPDEYLATAAHRPARVRQIAKSDAILCNGLGGDVIFYNASKISLAVDYARRHGIDRELIRLVYRQAFTGSTVWQALKQTVREGLLRRPVTIPNANYRSPFLDATHLADMERDLASQDAPLWRSLPTRYNDELLPPGKVRHIESLYFPTPTMDAIEHAYGMRRLTPLHSQPIIELFARIPIYVLKAGGRARAVAIRAFMADLPREIALRKSKGVSNSFMASLVQHHRPFFREVLLEGLLVKEKLLDRAKIERFLAGNPDGYSEGLVSLLGPQFNLEWWLRCWTERVRSLERAAA
jgi:asparagine synthase (glutamine-hydrolysing)